MKLTIDPEDERTRDPEPNDVWRESFWFDVIDEETGTGLLLYCGVQPVAGYGYGFVNLSSRDGQLFQFSDYTMPVPEHRGGQDVFTIGPFTVTNGEPLKSQIVSFEHPECSLKMKFTSDVSVYDYPWPWTRSRHWEQLGRAEAVIRRPGHEALVLKGASARDHAWGLRQLLTWHGFIWITCRALEEGPSWTCCWLRTDEGTQTLGHLVDTNGDTFIALSMITEVEYADAVPQSARIAMEFDGYGTVESSMDLYGHISMSRADPEKQGGYYFSFQEGDTNGRRSSGTFDIFWRDGLDPITRYPFELER